MPRTKKVAAVIASTLLIGLTGAPTAHAEGKKTTYIKGWTMGQESSRWLDRNTDSKKTKVKLSGCSSDGEGFRTATLALWRDVSWGRDKKIKTVRHKCGTYTFKDVPKGKHYFELGGFFHGGKFSAKRVVITW
ncbi:hypothetical protein ACWDBF_08030 [Streptomyces angustmyceticus]